MSDSTAPGRRPPFVLIIALVAMGPAALHILVPSMPGLQRALATDYATVQLTLSLFYAAFAVAQLVYGPLSDRFGRRPAMVAALVLYLVGSAICLVAPSIGVLVAGRVVQALGGCAGFALGRAIVRDLYAREKAASMLAYVTMFMVGVPMLAPLVGGYLDAWYGWRASFVVVLVYGGVLLGASLKALHETHVQRAPLGSVIDLATTYVRLLARPVFCGYSFQVGFNTACFFTFVGGAPYVLVELMGRPASEYGLYFVLVTVFYMAGNLIAGQVSMRVGIDRMILIGIVLSLAFTVALVAVTAAGALTPFWLFFLAGAMSFGNGVSQANSLAGAVSVDPTRAGAASGVTGFLQMAFGGLGAFVVGALLKQSAMPLVIAMLILTVLSLIAHVVGVRLSGGRGS